MEPSAGPAVLSFALFALSGCGQPSYYEACVNECASERDCYSHSEERFERCTMFCTDVDNRFLQDIEAEIITEACYEAAAVTEQCNAEESCEVRMRRAHGLATCFDEARKASDLCVRSEKP